MKNIYTALHAATTEQEKTEYWAERRILEHTIRTDLKNMASASIYSDGDKPADTVEKLVKAFGLETVTDVVAAAVNRCGDWDARVSRRVRDWAAAQDCWDAESADALGIMWEIFTHPCHLDSIAEALMERPAEPVEEPDAELPRLPSDVAELAEYGIDMELAAGNLRDEQDEMRLDDYIQQMSDAMTPVYTSDLLRVVARWPYIMEDAMREGLVDTGKGYTFSGHLMSAAYLFIENTIIDHFADFLIEVARQAYKKNGQTSTMSRWAEYCEWCRACLASETTVGELKEQIELAARH